MQTVVDRVAYSAQRNSNPYTICAEQISAWKSLEANVVTDHKLWLCRVLCSSANATNLTTLW